MTSCLDHLLVVTFKTRGLVFSKLHQIYYWALKKMLRILNGSTSRRNNSKAIIRISNILCVGSNSHKIPTKCECHFLHLTNGDIGTEKVSNSTKITQQMSGKS